MASAAEQLASNMSFGAFSKATELKQRLWFTLGALLVYRIGTYIPLPGVNISVIQDIFSQNSSGILGMFNVFAGGAVERMTIFALNIIPYISASIIVQLMTAVVPTLEAMKKEGEAGRKRINQYTRYLTVLLATVQAFSLAVGLEGLGGGNAVTDPGAFFRVSTVICLVGGTVFLMWLGEQISQRGVGTGISLIIFAGIVANLPAAIAQVLELGRTGAMSPIMIILILLLAIATIAFIVFMERAQRRLLIQYPKRQIGMKMTQGEASHLPLKLNVSGVIPAIFASSLMLLPLTIAGFGGQSEGFVADIANMLGRGSPLYFFLYGTLIAFFCFFYTSVVFNPVDTADNLKKHGGYIPGIRPGQATADYIDQVLTRLTVVGASYLVLVCLMPELLISQYSIPFYLGGTSLLIVVTVTMDTVGQIQSHLISHQYEGLLKRSKLGGKRK